MYFQHGLDFSAYSRVQWPWPSNPEHSWSWHNESCCIQYLFDVATPSLNFNKNGQHLQLTLVDMRLSHHKPFFMVATSWNLKRHYEEAASQGFTLAMYWISLGVIRNQKEEQVSKTFVWLYVWVFWYVWIRLVSSHTKSIMFQLHFPPSGKCQQRGWLHRSSWYRCASRCWRCQPKNLWTIINIETYMDNIGNIWCIYIRPNYLANLLRSQPRSPEKLG